MACLLAPLTSTARHPDLDLDSLSDAAIDALIQKELDDDDLRACGLANPNGPMDDERLVEVVMCALGDDNDDDDEDDLDLEDLEAECAEAGTTVEAVVRRSVLRADEIARMPAPAADPMAAMTVELSDAAAGAVSPLWLALADGKTNPAKTVVAIVKQEMRGVIRRA